MRSAAARPLSSRQSPQHLDKPFDVILVLIDSEPDPEHVPTHVGDAIPRLELCMPALRARRAKSEEAGVRRSVERVEQLGGGERRALKRAEELLLQGSHNGRRARRGEAV